MSFTDLFRQVTSWSADELRQFLAARPADEYQLVDVRQLHEYGDQHLPGAHWIPAAELPHRTADLDPSRTTIVYCSHGIRSRAACQVLINAGFEKVINLRGGLHGWQGQLADGLPQIALDYFGRAENAVEATLLAWQIEENTRRYYEELADTLTEPGCAALFAELAAAESHHKAMLKAIWEALVAQPAPEDFPRGLLPFADQDLLEGGLLLSDAIAWSEDRSIAQLIEMAMAMEINAFDHYLTLQRGAEDADTVRLFELLANEERHHLKLLASALEALPARS